MKLMQRIHPHRADATRIEQLWTFPLLESMSESELHEIDRFATFATIEPGQVLMREGSPGDAFYLILDGHASVWREGQMVSRLRPGDYCGELALLTNEPRDATVVAACPMEVMVFDEAAFAALLVEVPRLAKALLLRTSQRLRRVEERAAV